MYASMHGHICFDTTCIGRPRSVLCCLKDLRLRAFFGRFNKVYEACLFRPSRFQRCAI